MAATLGDVTAAILAGGRGTRLYPIVSDRPKALAPVLGRPYLSYLLDFLCEAGVRKVVLLTGYMAEQIESAFGDRYGSVSLVYSREPRPLGTGGALRYALRLFKSSAVLVLNGDSFWGIELPTFWKFHTTHDSRFSLGVTWVPDASRYGRVHLEGHRVCRFDEKEAGGDAGWINAGVYLASREFLNDIPPDIPVSLEHDMFPRWVEARSCFAYCSPVPFLDIGTPDSFARAAEFFGNRPAA
jgi:D-glycero-alpha-D-manno-heptose 1-phosphate guanylyltransferase